MILVFNSCVKDENFTEIDFDTPTISDINEVSVQGRVYQGWDVPLEARVTAFVFENGSIIGKTIVCNSAGFFSFRNIQVPGNSVHLRVEMDGYFTLDRRVTIIENESIFTDIKLIKKTTRGTFYTNQGGSVALNNGAKVDFPSDCYINDDGSVYQGIVHVKGHYLLPGSLRFEDIRIGNLTGISADGESTGLISYGMMQVELYGDGGQPINLNEKQPAFLHFPKPSGFREYPSEIPSWTLDESRALWIESDTAHLSSDNFYVMKAYHFSSFNVDWKIDPIEISGRVTLCDEPDGPAPSFYEIFVSSDVFGRIGGRLTDDGRFRFINFPRDVEFTIEIFNNCNLVWSGQFGPFNEITDIGEICVEEDQRDKTVLTGTFLDCDKNPISKGALSLVDEEWNILRDYPLHNGVINIRFDRCSLAAKFVVVCDENGKKSDLIPLEGGFRVNLGEILVCEGQPFSHYLELVIGGDSMRFEGDIWTKYPYLNVINYQSTIDNRLYTISNNITHSERDLEIQISRMENMNGRHYAELEFEEMGTQNGATYYSFQNTLEIEFDEKGMTSGSKVSGKILGMAGEDKLGPYTIPVTGNFSLRIR